MQFIEMRDRFLDAFLAETGPRSDVWRDGFLSCLAAISNAIALPNDREEYRGLALADLRLRKAA